MKIGDFLKQVGEAAKGKENYEMQIEVDFEDKMGNVIFERNKKNKLFTMTFGGKE